MAAPSSLALIQLTGLLPQPLPCTAVSQWAPKAGLASPLSGPIQTSRPPVNGGTSPISSFACCLGFALPAGVLRSPPVSPLRSQQFWLLFLVSRGQLFQPPAHVGLQPHSCAQPISCLLPRAGQRPPAPPPPCPRPRVPSPGQQAISLLERK